MNYLEYGMNPENEYDDYWYEDDEYMDWLYEQEKAEMEKLYHKELAQKMDQHSLQELTEEEYEEMMNNIDSAFFEPEDDVDMY